LIMLASKPSGISGLLASSLELQAGQGAPGPPQLHASRPSHGFIGWFSQIQWQLQQRAHHLMSEILSQPFEEAMAQRGRNKLPAAIDSNSSGSSSSAALSVGPKGTIEPNLCGGGLRRAAGAFFFSKSCGMRLDRGIDVSSPNK
jgi:hypothetical protein